MEKNIDRFINEPYFDLMDSLRACPLFLYGVIGDEFDGDQFCNEFWKQQ
jgi:hypothetical protein